MDSEKANLLVVFADQWRRQTMGLNSPEVYTPHFDMFARDSVYCLNATTTCPLCSPFRACLFTGDYPVKNGVYGNCMSGYPIALRREDECLSDVLYASGYRTGYIGKWHLDEPEGNYCEKPVSEAKGWDAYTPPGARRHHFTYWHAYNADSCHLHPHYWENTAEKLCFDEWSPIHETDKAIEYISKCKENPFALFMSWNPPHTPFHMVPEKYMEPYKSMPFADEKANNLQEYNHHTGEPGISGAEQLRQCTQQYYAAVTGLDEQFGRLIACLKENKLYDNTLIVLTSDHGEHLGAHHLMGKHTWYEESISVPLMLRYPKKLQAHYSELCFSTVNLRPTLLSLLGIEAEGINENDLSPYLEGKMPKDNDCAFLSAYISREVFINAFKNEGVAPVDAGWRAVRDGRYTYVLFRGYTPRDASCAYFYDRKADIYQEHPICFSNKISFCKAAKLHRILMTHLSKENPGFAAWASGYYTVGD